MENRTLTVSLVSENVNKNYCVMGKYDAEKKILSYQDKSEEITDTIMDLKNNILTRENPHYQILYQFSLNEVTVNKIFVKDLNQSVEIKLKTTKIVNKKGYYEVEYLLINSEEKVLYKIEY